MKYPFTVFQAQADGHLFWVAEITALPGCTGQGDTPEAAYAELEENEKDWLETAEKYGIEIPAIPVTHMEAYSGKFTVRVAPWVHQDAVENAKKQNISLNQYVNDAIVSLNSRMATIDYIVPQVKEIAYIVKSFFFDNAATCSRGASKIECRLNPCRLIQNGLNNTETHSTMAVQ